MLVAVLVLGARWLLGTAWGSDFLTHYSGAAPMPDSAPTGTPGWLAWQHFLNFFFMALILKTGMQFRHEKRPPAYWRPRGGRSKISLTLWLHLSVDALWLLNGAVFLVALFCTGQWMRIVPTSWRVFPEALSAGLQYLSLTWPTENGWVHYNGLQQLAYFLVVFIAAPLAALSGWRLSLFWPDRPQALQGAYPLWLARRLHVATMVFFVIFVIVHVALVFATGALRNLNHMFAAQGSADAAAYANNWAGFWIFVLAAAGVGAALAAARPVFFAPAARRLGEVTAR